MDQPSKFGRYEVKGVIGKGAMGVIYLAEDPVIGRQVAIKVIQVQPGLSEKEIESLKLRFEREFRSAGTLSHPNIVTVHDVGTEGNAPFIAMEYVPGKTLEHLMNEQRLLTFEEIATLVTQICDALDYAHAHGVVHRDIKPANILLDRNQRPKITDFGVAKLADTGMTHTGAMVGTPWYMSPEQVVGEAVTGAANQFSVAVMTYQLLTRERPFSGERSSTVLYKIVHEEPTRPHLLNPRLQEQIDDVLLRAFQKNPADRYPSCVSFARDLEAALGVAAVKLGASGAGTIVPPTEWPTASFTLDAAKFQELQAAARSGAAGAVGESAGTGSAQSGGGSRAGSGAGSRAASRGSSGARPLPGPATEIAAADLGETLAAPPAGHAPAATAVVDGDSPGTTIRTSRRDAAAGLRGLRPAAIAGIAAAAAAALALALWLPSRGGGAPEPAPAVLPLEEMLATEAESAPLDVLPADVAADLPVPDIEGAAEEGEDTAAASHVYRIVTRPAGASVLVDGEAVEQVTPAEVELRSDARQTIELRMEGFKVVRWPFSAERLTDDQRRTRTLFFPLVAIDPGPAEVATAEDEGVDEEALAAAEAVLPTAPRGTLDPDAPTVRGGQEVPQPRRIEDASPVYDRSRVPSDRQPIVVLELTLDPDGYVADAKILRGLSPELDRAALQTAWQWRYAPSVHRGKPANVVITSTVIFDAP